MHRARCGGGLGGGGRFREVNNFLGGDVVDRKLGCSAGVLLGDQGGFGALGVTPWTHGEPEAGFAARRLAAECLIVGGNGATVFVFDAEELLVFYDLAFPHGDNSLEDGLALVFLFESAPGMENEVRREREIDDQFLDEEDTVFRVELALHGLVGLHS